MKEDDPYFDEEMELQFKLHRGNNKRSGYSVEQLEDGCYYIGSVPKKSLDYNNNNNNDSCVLLGDRVLEINGIPWQKFQTVSRANALLDDDCKKFIHLTVSRQQDDYYDDDVADDTEEEEEKEYDDYDDYNTTNTMEHKNNGQLLSYSDLYCENILEEDKEDNEDEDPNDNNAYPEQASFVRKVCSLLIYPKSSVDHKPVGKRSLYEDDEDEYDVADDDSDSGSDDYSNDDDEDDTYEDDDPYDEDNSNHFYKNKRSISTIAEGSREGETDDDDFEEDEEEVSYTDSISDTESQDNNDNDNDNDDAEDYSLEEEDNDDTSSVSSTRQDDDPVQQLEEQAKRRWEELERQRKLAELEKAKVDERLRALQEKQQERKLRQCENPTLKENNTQPAEEQPQNHPVSPKQQKISSPIGNTKNTITNNKVNNNNNNNTNTTKKYSYSTTYKNKKNSMGSSSSSSSLFHNGESTYTKKSSNGTSRIQIQRNMGTYKLRGGEGGWNKIV